MAKLHEAFLASVVTAAIGQLLRRLFLHTPQQRESIGLVSKMLIYVTIPALLFRTMYNGVHQVPIEGMSLAAACLLYELLMVAISTLVFHRVERHRRGVCVGSSCSFAIGMFFLSLMEAIAGQDGLVLLALFDVPNAFFVYIAEPLIFRLLSRPQNALNNPSSSTEDEAAIQLTPPPMSVDEPAIKKRPKWMLVLLGIVKFISKNVSLVCVTLGLVFGLTGVTLPSWIVGIVDIPANGNTLVSYLLIGLFLDADPKVLRDLWKYAAVALSLRYIIGIATGITLYLTVGKFFFSPLGRLVLLIGFVMPLPASVTALAADNGVDPSLCSLVTSCTFVLSFCIIWAMTSIVGVPMSVLSSSSSS